MLIGDVLRFTTYKAHGEGAPMPRKKRGPGHPITTGMASTPPIHFRVSASQHAELIREGRKARLSANQVAKRRCFAGTTETPR
jgi:hypothetical protein